MNTFRKEAARFRSKGVRSPPSKGCISFLQLELWPISRGQGAQGLYRCFAGIRAVTWPFACVLVRNLKWFIHSGRLNYLNEVQVCTRPQQSSVFYFHAQFFLIGGCLVQISSKRNVETNALCTRIFVVSCCMPARTMWTELFIASRCSMYCVVKYSVVFNMLLRQCHRFVKLKDGGLFHN